MANLTTAQKRALEWFAANEPIGLFPFDGPSRQVRLNLERMGFIEIVDRRQGHFIKFARTEAGRRALENRDG